MKLVSRLVVVVVLVLMLGSGPTPAGLTRDAANTGLPPGRPSLPESRSTREIAPGVTYQRIERGFASKRDFYTLDVAFTSTRREAREIKHRLKRDDYRARVERIAERAPDDPQRGPLGLLVRVGRFSTASQADALRAKLVAEGYSSARVVHTSEDGRKTTGPWIVHVLTVEPDIFQGFLTPELATEIVPERELLSSIAARTDAVASINAGYFVIGETDGTPGDLAGISALDGELVSESVAGRTSLALPAGPGDGALIAVFDTAIEASSSDGATRLVDGINRKPGLVRSCGGTGGDQPTERPKHDITCTDDSELIHFTPIFGASTERGPGTEVVLDATGSVVEVRGERGGSIPPGGSVLSGTRSGSRWLRNHAEVGQKIALTSSVTADGAAFPLPGGLGIVNGGPRLVRDGAVDITAFDEGFHHRDNPEFYYRFGVRRNPRTLAGVTDEGDLVPIAADGRLPGYSVGLNFEEEALVMRALDARDAVNLDGGGSTGITIGDQLVNRPSDPTGERPIGDALVLTD
ncbi:phosphodiester glycosidase family protein [soil metagenome]